VATGCSDTAILADVLVFVCKHRRLAAVSHACRNTLDVALHRLLTVVASNFDVYVLEVYPQSHNAEHTPDILRRGGRIAGGGVDAETAWQILERSKQVYGATPEIVVAVKSDEGAFMGLTSRTGSKCTSSERYFGGGRVWHDATECRIVRYQKTRCHTCPAELSLAFL
jgi:hypothetical protein